MLGYKAALKLITGAVLFAAIAYALMAAPGLLFDADSTVPNAAPRLEAVR